MCRLSWRVLPVLLDFASIAAATVVDLTKVSWTLRDLAGNISIPTKIPSVAHIDLFRAGLIEEPVYGNNDERQLWVAKSAWTYSTAGLKLPAKHEPSQNTYLVFNGLDTFTQIYLCNQTVGSTSNQFRQWIFNISPILTNRSMDCELDVTFWPVTAAADYLAKAYEQEYSSPISVLPNRSLMRKEQNDFGWDWSPAFAPSGIWQPAYLVELDSRNSSSVYVTNSAVDIYRYGQLNNIPPDQSKPWVLNVSMDYIGAQPRIDTLDFEITDANGHVFTAETIRAVAVTKKTIQGSIIINGSPELWWPVGYGSQSLYTLTVTATNAANPAVATVKKRIGFRTIVLNQGLVTKEQQARGISPGGNWHFEINGRELFVKGSNLVPLDVFWPNVTEQAARTLLETALAGNQNMLRVWASGAYLPDFVYDIADELGILLWSEFQFSDATYPTDGPFLDNVYQEANYQSRRVNHHPSLALWCGNNELALFLVYYAQHSPEIFAQHHDRFLRLFLDVLLHAVFDNSKSISYSFSSGSDGYLSLNHSAPMPMVPRLNETSHGLFKNTGMRSSIPPDILTYYMTGSLLTYQNLANWYTDYYNYDSSQAFNISQYPIGRLAVEFGYISHPNFETYARYLPASALVSNSSLIIHRNRHYVDGLTNATYPSDNVIPSLKGLGHMSRAIALNLPFRGKSDPLQQFRTEVYSSQLFQAQFYRSQIEFYRMGSGQPQRTLGSLYWQLNDVWAAPTWASVNADGRWKILHYTTRAAYENVIVSPFVFDKTPNEVSVYVTSDLWSPISAAVDIEWYSWAGKRIYTTPQVNLNVGPVNSTLATKIDMTTLPFKRAEAVAFLTVNATSPDGRRYTSTRVFNPAPLNDPVSMKRMASNSTTAPVSVSYDRSQKKFVLESRSLAAWVWIDQPEGVKGYFNENAFWMLPGKKTIEFTRTAGERVAEEDFEVWAAKVTVRSLWDSL